MNRSSICARPTFTVDYVINPWMTGQEGSLDLDWPSGTPLKARRMLVGFKVNEVDLSEFLKGGGSAKSLT